VSDLETTQQESTEVLDLAAPNEGEEGTLESMPARTSVARWYAVQVASSCEKKVKATLEQRAVTLGVSTRILEIEIPETPAIKVKKRWKPSIHRGEGIPGLRVGQDGS
jgi:transcriptional antiterminator NusG